MDENKFCPIIKDICKGDLCLAWNEGICSVFNFFANLNNLNRLNSEKTYISKEQIIKDEAMAEQLLPDFLEWALSKKITRPTREEIKTFLTVKGIIFCEAAMRLLWRQAKVKLRELKREMDILASQKWRENKSNIGLAWSSDEDDALLKGFDSGKSSFDLSKEHKRTVRAIELRLAKYGKIQLSK